MTHRRCEHARSTPAHPGRTGPRPVAWLAVVLGLLCAAPAGAHPIPRRAHDRTITVRLLPDRVQVEYGLEVDEWTVVFQDLPAVLERVDLERLTKPADFYDAFTRSYAPVLADNLLATCDGQPLAFTCVRRSHQLLDHLRCDFLFQASLAPASGPPHELTFREGNYELEPGLIRLTLVHGPGVTVLRQTEPDPALQAKTAGELGPGEEEQLRKVAATFRVAEQAAVPAAVAAAPAPAAAAEPPAGARHSLLALLLDTRQGMGVLLLLAGVFGAAHALTPGHGKTLVAAYLVGERGTIGHAVVLGLVTTLTHTGAVLLLAALLLLAFPDAVPRDVQMALGLGGGLLVAGLGLWLLLRRLAGGADHFHLGGHGHHHHHHHDVPTPRADDPVGWWGLVVLGISGGIVPCWDAVVMLGFAVSAQRLWLAVPLLLAFSAGLAGVLVAIGIAVVYAKGFASSHWGESRLVKALPLLSAALVTGLGLWLCYDSVHPATTPAAARTELRP